jgi:dienelactone hydrolase
MSRFSRSGRCVAAALALAPALSTAQQAAPAPKADYSAPAGAPYRAEEVTVSTTAGHTLAGTLTLPAGASRTTPVGAIITITGSGPQDRDEYLGFGDFRPFRQLADSLGRRGIAVLRMDDRGTGASTGTFKRTTSAEFAEDIRAGLAYLRTRPEIDATRLGVVGHSEGAVIAPMVADAEPSVRAIVLLAGVAQPVRSALDMQMKNLIMHNTKLTDAGKDSARRGDDGGRSMDEVLPHLRSLRHRPARQDAGVDHHGRERSAGAARAGGRAGRGIPRRWK